MITSNCYFTEIGLISYTIRNLLIDHALKRLIKNVSLRLMVNTGGKLSILEIYDIKPKSSLQTLKKKRF